jgi:ankyrin repeat protein
MNLHDFIYAIKKGFLKYVKDYLKQFNDKEITNIINTLYDTKYPLNIAVYNHQTKIVKLFLKYKPDLNIKDFNGYTPLMNTPWNKDTKILKALLNTKGINVNHVSKDNKTVLMIASIGHLPIHSKMISLLIKAGADVNMRDNYNRTALFTAYNRGSIKTVKLLIKAGSNTCEKEFDKLYTSKEIKRLLQTVIFVMPFLHKKFNSINENIIRSCLDYF